jgi:hypothetical protein
MQPLFQRKNAAVTGKNSDIQVSEIVEKNGKTGVENSESAVIGRKLT